MVAESAGDLGRPGGRVGRAVTVQQAILCGEILGLLVRANHRPVVVAPVQAERRVH